MAHRGLLYVSDVRRWRDAFIGRRRRLDDPRARRATPALPADRSRRSANVLYAATYGDGVWRTTRPRPLVRSRSSPPRRYRRGPGVVGSDLYAVGPTGLFRSPDRGVTWAPVGAGQAAAGGARPGVDDPDVVHGHRVRLVRHDEALRGGQFKGAASVMASGDGGASWSPLLGASGVRQTEGGPSGPTWWLATNQLATSGGSNYLATQIALDPVVDGGWLHAPAGTLVAGPRRRLRDDRRRGHLVPDDARAGAHGGPRGRERIPTIPVGSTSLPPIGRSRRRRTGVHQWHVTPPPPRCSTRSAWRSARPRRRARCTSRRASSPRTRERSGRTPTRRRARLDERRVRRGRRDPAHRGCREPGRGPARDPGDGAELRYLAQGRRASGRASTRTSAGAASHRSRGCRDQRSATFYDHGTGVWRSNDARSDLDADLEPALARRHDRLRGGRPDGALAALRVRRRPVGLFRLEGADVGTVGGGIIARPVGTFSAPGPIAVRSDGAITAVELSPARATDRRRLSADHRRDVVDEFSDTGFGATGGFVRVLAPARRQCGPACSATASRCGRTVVRSHGQPPPGRGPAGSHRCPRDRLPAACASVVGWGGAVALSASRTRHRRSLGGRGADARERGVSVDVDTGAFRHGDVRLPISAGRIGRSGQRRVHRGRSVRRERRRQDGCHHHFAGAHSDVPGTDPERRHVIRGAFPSAGASDSTGFRLRYLMGSADVTARVRAGTFRDRVACTRRQRGPDAHGGRRCLEAGDGPTTSSVSARSVVQQPSRRRAQRGSRSASTRRRDD